MHFLALVLTKAKKMGDLRKKKYIYILLLLTPNLLTVDVCLN